MKFRTLLGLVVGAAMIFPSFAAAEPPSHAPAHGYRAKHGTKPATPPQKGGIEVVFDSALGIHVAVGLPDVLFYSGRYYRERDGRWEVSVTGKGGWSVSVASKIPGTVVEARKHKHKKKKANPGPARIKNKRGRGK